MTGDEEAVTVTIKIERSDGGVYISSEDVPGLWLWGSDPDKVFEDIVPTIRELYSLNNGRSVDVQPVHTTESRSARRAGIENIHGQYKIIARAEGQRDQTV